MRAMQPDPLAQLQDIELPPEVGFWPPAWPWWLLVIAIICLATASVIYYRRNRWRRAAIARLNELNSKDNQEYVIAINRLLKQIYVSRYGQGQSLSGIKWLASLDRKTKTPLFLPDLEDFAHAPDSGQTLDVNLLKMRAQQWIRRAK
ncbi:DUF4381 domain-containing protein [Bermanella marisrubri]|uniref:DUF4381 domain-containing protein n=1 Tax=Bermanella marisrubri TaxID=207949 RepID=Q1N643_9GAMM|nr:DUF4381 domain-containing protein [Bermanella marisrubri]EAT13749.1 hypothetical protein RED65_10164 [Oceanobacter sp. RED65] [Bermanella marisrubri]QIZ84523.1 DUF4381 domain-containing protein [Bermanella marisrubri]